MAERKWFTPDLIQRVADESLISRFDIGKITPEALLWQTGYLTIQTTEEAFLGFQTYILSYPNREVEMALNKSLLHEYGPDAQSAVVSRSHLYKALSTHDMHVLRQSIESLFASIPHDWYRKNPLAQFEGHYASVFYSQLAALGLNVQAEDVTHKGKIDLSLKLENRVYLFEFKVTDGEPDGSALQQLIDRDYAAKHRAPGVEITLIGIEFGRAERNVLGFETQIQQ